MAATNIEPNSSKQSKYNVIRRNGQVTSFDDSKIAVAISKAFLAVEGDSGTNSSRIHDVVKSITAQVTDSLTRRLDDGGTVHIEDIQDQVELALMREGEYKVARAYVLYRESQKQKRAEEEAAKPHLVQEEAVLNVTAIDGS